MAHLLITALAHAGHHDPAEDGLLHALTQPDHLLVLGAVVAATFAVYRAFRRPAAKPTPQPEALPPSPSVRGRG